MAYQPSSSKFSDVDDDAFLRHSKSGSSGYMFQSDSLSREQQDLEDRRLQLLEKRRQIEQRTVESSNRSIGLLRDSEQIGVATAEELVRQREQLERTESRLDEINNTLRFSQKHINGIKSVFGSLKNYISGRGANANNANASTSQRPAEVSRETTALASRLQEMKPESPNDDHPALRIRGLTEERTSSGSSGIRDANRVLDDNLDEMCSGLARLKGLASGLNEEIVGQNEMLDRITTKTEKADTTIDHQNRDMRRILKK
ncbi:synaptosomal-associated protein 29 [Cloeon dipterum]